MERIAVIDLGSNSVRMTINHLYPDGSYRMVEEVRTMVRLSEQMGEEFWLRPEPIKRTIQALLLFRKLIHVHGAKVVVPIATAAVRQAGNREMFLKRIEVETGFSFRVITGDEEAWYDYLGVVNTIGLDTYYYIDIGGASTEIGLVEGRSLSGSVSLPWGAVNITEHFEIGGKAQKKKCFEAEKYMMGALSTLPFVKESPRIPIIGLGGTIRTLAKVDKKRKNHPVEGIHAYELKADQVYTDYNDWLSLSVRKKRAVPGLGKSRADIISGALTPLIAMLKSSKAEQLIISGNGLREGVFFDILSDRLKTERILPDVKGHHVSNLMKLYGIDEAHANHVKMLALAAFDQLSVLHGIPLEMRQWLGTAALLHDIGMHIDYYNHHQHSFYLIMNTGMNGFSHRERIIVACLSGMHRENSDLKIDMRPYETVLRQEDSLYIRKMAPFLMLAERLDRSESGVVKDIQFKVSQDAIRANVITDGDAKLEIDAASMTTIAFEKIYNKRIEIQVKP